MGEWWAAAVAAAGEQPPADLSAAVAEELIALWSDLGEAIRRAADRSWSVECDGLVHRCRVQAGAARWRSRGRGRGRGERGAWGM